MRYKRLLVLILGGFAAMAVLLLPMKKTVAPAAQVRVYDEAGLPAGRIIVKQQWEYRASGSEGHEEILRTDENGRVSFPERTENISTLRLVISFVREIIHLPHGYGLGPYATIWAYGEDAHIWYFVPCTPEHPAPQEIRLKRWDVTMYP
ncbi:MAG TPA: hypothetical protein VF736_05755 [Pyrinomonadaceae bacterium]